MEERMQELRKLYAGVSEILEKWMKEDMDTKGRPASYSIDQAMMFMRTSYMWTSDAAAQTLHFQKEVAPKLEVVD